MCVGICRLEVSPEHQCVSSSSMVGTEPSLLLSLFFWMRLTSLPLSNSGLAHPFSFFGLAIFLNQTSAWTFFEMQHQSQHCPWWHGKSFPHLMDVPPGLIPLCQELEATRPSPPSSQCWKRSVLFSCLFLCIFPHVNLAEESVHTYVLCQVWEGQHRLSVPSVPF